MLPKTTQGKLLFLSLSVNALLVIVLGWWFVSCKAHERVVRSASWSESSARLHGSMLKLENFRKNQQRPSEDFVRELREGEVAVFLLNVNGLAWVEKLDASDDESLLRLKGKLQLAREFIAANPDLFSIGLKTNLHPPINVLGTP